MSWRSAPCTRGRRRCRFAMASRPSRRCSRTSPLRWSTSRSRPWSPSATTRCFATRSFDASSTCPTTPRHGRQQSAGSGVIIDAERGFVLSNHHVVARADSVMVTLKDNRRFEAEILGSDPGTDIALLRIEADGLQRACDRRQRRTGSRRLRHRHRQSLRSRPDRHIGDRQRARAQRDQCRGLRGLHSDRRLDQPGKLGRRAREPAR